MIKNKIDDEKNKNIWGEKKIDPGLTINACMYIYYFK
jgi:hypothetical protein